MVRKASNLEGRHFGRIEVVSFDSMRSGAEYYNCRCSCSGDEEKDTFLVKGYNLVNGKKTSCGCIEQEERDARECSCCGKAVHALGLCKNCHTRFLRRGTTDYLRKPKGPKVKSRDLFIAELNPTTCRGRTFLELYKAGMSCVEIGKKYGIVSETVRRTMKR